MINPAQLVDSVVTALQGIPDLVSAMGSSAENIYAHHFLYGAENSLIDAVYKITPPGILVAYEGTLGGNFDAATIWKHKVACYIRAANATNQENPVSYEDIWSVIMNGPVNGGPNIRCINVMPNTEIMDTPSIEHQIDQDGIDFFVVHLVFPEIGDS